MSAYKYYNFSVKDLEGNEITSGLQVTVCNVTTGAEATIYSDEGTTALTNSITSTVFATNGGIVKFFSTASTVDILLLNTTTRQATYRRAVTPGDNYIVFDTSLHGLDAVALVTATEYAIPSIGSGLVTAAVTMADTSNDDITLGKMNIITGSTVTAAVIGDTGLATVGRTTVAVNHSAGTIVCGGATTDNDINGIADCEVTLYPEGWVALVEVANDMCIVVAGSGYALAASA